MPQTAATVGVAALATVEQPAVLVPAAGLAGWVTQATMGWVKEATMDWVRGATMEAWLEAVVVAREVAPMGWAAKLGATKAGAWVAAAMVQ